MCVHMENNSVEMKKKEARQAMAADILRRPPCDGAMGEKVTIKLPPSPPEVEALLRAIHNGEHQFNFEISFRYTYFFNWCVHTRWVVSNDHEQSRRGAFRAIAGRMVSCRLLTRQSLAEVFDRGAFLAVHDEVILLLLGSCLDPLPWEIPAQKVYENVTVDVIGPKHNPCSDETAPCARQGVGVCVFSR